MDKTIIAKIYLVEQAKYSDGSAAFLLYGSYGRYDKVRQLFPRPKYDADVIRLAYELLDRPFAFTEGSPGFQRWNEEPANLADS